MRIQVTFGIRNVKKLDKNGFGGRFYSDREFIHFSAYPAGLPRPGNPISILYILYILYYRHSLREVGALHGKPTLKIGS